MVSGFDSRSAQGWGGSTRLIGRSHSRGHGVVVMEVISATGRGIGANVEVEDSSRGTRGQLVGGTVEVQVGRMTAES